MTAPEPRRTRAVSAVWIVTFCEKRWDRGDPIKAFASEVAADVWLDSDEARARLGAFPFSGFDVFELQVDTGQDAAEALERWEKEQGGNHATIS